MILFNFYLFKCEKILLLINLGRVRLYLAPCNLGDLPYREFPPNEFDFLPLISNNHCINVIFYYDPWSFH